MNPELVQDELDGLIRVSIPHLVRLQGSAAGISLRPGRVQTTEQGPHLSIFKGRGMEFAESRPYQMGDDIRQLDWRVMARTGKPYTKLFREERERPVLFWTDLGHNQFFATRGAYKAVRVAEITALLSWAAYQQGNRIGGIIAANQSPVMHKPMRGKPSLLRFLGNLAQHPAWSQTHTANTTQAFEHGLPSLRRMTHPGSLVVLVSDFSQLDEQDLKHFVALHQHSELLFNFIYDPFETRLPPSASIPVTDGLRRLRLNGRDGRTARDYQEQFQQRLDRIRTFSNRHNIPLIEYSSWDKPVQQMYKRLGRHA